MKNDDRYNVNLCPFRNDIPEMLIGIERQTASPDRSTDSRQSEYSQNTETWD